MIEEAVRSGRAAESFGAMVAAQGGPLGFVEDWARYLPEATVIREVPAPARAISPPSTARRSAFVSSRLAAGGAWRPTRSTMPSASPASPRSARRCARASPSPAFTPAAKAPPSAEAAVLSAMMIGAEPELPPLVHERVG